MESQRASARLTQFSNYAIDVRPNLERKIEIKSLLAAAIGRMNLSLDVWTSTNHLSFLGIVAHFVGKPYLLLQRRCTC